jgi:hypothetical protein
MAAWTLTGRSGPEARWSEACPPGGLAMRLRSDHSRVDAARGLEELDDRFAR